MKKTIRVTATILLACAGFLNTSAKAQDNEESEDIRKVRVALQEKFDKLPEVKVNDMNARGTFITVDLGKSLTEVDGGKYYAFRFRSPAESGDLVWSFTAAGKGLDSWYIFSEKERMKGFFTFTDRILPQDIEKVGKKGERFVLQKLSHQNMKPESGYIMWFKYKEGGEPRVTLSLNFAAKDLVNAYKALFPMMYPEEK